MRIMALLFLLCAAFVSAYAQSAPANPNHSYCEAISQSVEHPAELTKACEWVTALKQRLPDIICQQTTLRYAPDESGKVSPALRDKLEARVTLEDGNDSYSDIRLNGTPVHASMQELAGTWSIGEFGALAQIVFHPATNAKFKFHKETEVNSKPALAYEFHVDKEHNKGWTLRAPAAATYPAFRGEVWVAKENGQLLRLSLQSTEIEPGFPLTGADVAVDYSDLELGDGSHFTLPQRSQAVTCARSSDTNKAQGICSKNILTFDRCRKFAAKSRILTDAKPDSKDPKQ